MKDSARDWLNAYETIEKGNKKLNRLADSVLSVPHELLHFFQQKTAQINDSDFEPNALQ